ncbi:hypothetical protein Q5741_11065 [Paenibacillus sp. JX-17]|uniref:Uncharacterized protein n=1 Tax=Paenibacillus lacisoli TaxID=3064525 RepID=A0ABT9CDL6_9BACL|nr:hypothetical protein [Paenibacillus sp. JX-17]MDO7906955.1 hypothetical protein [Paenibacillus sp. JX-17]
MFKSGSQQIIYQRLLAKNEWSELSRMPACVRSDGMTTAPEQITQSRIAKRTNLQSSDGSYSCRLPTGKSDSYVIEGPVEGLNEFMVSGTVTSADSTVGLTHTASPYIIQYDTTRELGIKK